MTTKIVAGIQRRNRNKRIRLFIPDYSMEVLSNEVNKTDPGIISNPDTNDHYVTNLYLDSQTNRFMIQYDDMAKGETGGKIQVISNPLETEGCPVTQIIYDSNGRIMVEHTET